LAAGLLLAVAVGVEFRLDPKVVADPKFGIFKLGDDLRFAVGDNGNLEFLALRLRRVTTDQHHKKADARAQQGAVSLLGL
jgi:hypothetical protein